MCVQSVLSKEVLQDLCCFTGRQTHYAKAYTSKRSLTFREVTEIALFILNTLKIKTYKGVSWLLFGGLCLLSLTPMTGSGLFASNMATPPHFHSLEPNCKTAIGSCCPILPTGGDMLLKALENTDGGSWARVNFCFSESGYKHLC